ncbi:unnamed protein product, partial [Prorocentrum cordatum]
FESVSQSVNQTVRQPVGQPVSQKVSQEERGDRPKVAPPLRAPGQPRVRRLPGPVRALLGREVPELRAALRPGRRGRRGGRRPTRRRCAAPRPAPPPHLFRRLARPRRARRR